MNELLPPDRQADQIDDSTAVMWEADPQTLRFTYVSRGAEKLLGYPLEHWLNSPSFWVDLVHPYDRERAYAECRAAIDSCEDREVQYRVIRSDGGIVWLRDVLRVVCEGGGQPTALRGVMLDVTERRRAHPHARKMEIVGQFTEAIAHDVDNVLTTIRGNVDLAMSSKLSLGVRQELQEIQKAVESGSGLLRQLLNFGQRAAGPLETIDLHATLTDLTGAIERLVGPAVQVHFAIAPQPALVRMGRGMLERVMMNIAANARDAMPGGGRLLIATRVQRIALVRQGQTGYMEIEVADTGIGMSRHTRERIFEPFFTTKEPGRSIGLGLSTVYNIVTEAGGHIDVDTEVGRGARFIIRLPLAN